MLADFSQTRAALFDLDGTLIETHIDFQAMRQAMEGLAEEAGVPDDAVCGKDILTMVEAAVEDVAGRGGDDGALRRRAFATLETMEVDGCAHPDLLPGTRETLSELLARGIKIGVVTRNCRAVSIGLLARFGLPHHLLLTRDDVRRTKPHPEHLWDALRLLDVPAHQSLMVGDHWMDIQAGVKAGCSGTLGILGKHDVDWFAPCPPQVTVRDLSEALPLFG